MNIISLMDNILLVITLGSNDNAQFMRLFILNTVENIYGAFL